MDEDGQGDGSKKGPDGGIQETKHAWWSTSKTLHTGRIL
jgi:hypothetical protein